MLIANRYYRPGAVICLEQANACCRLKVKIHQRPFHVTPVLDSEFK